MEPNQKYRIKLIFILKNRTKLKSGGLNRFQFLKRKIDLIIFLIKVKLNKKTKIKLISISSQEILQSHQGKTR